MGQALQLELGSLEALCLHTPAPDMLYRHLSTLFAEAKGNSAQGSRTLMYPCFWVPLGILSLSPSSMPFLSQAFYSPACNTGFPKML